MITKESTLERLQTSSGRRVLEKSFMYDEYFSKGKSANDLLRDHPLLDDEETATQIRAIFEAYKEFYK